MAGKMKDGDYKYFVHDFKKRHANCNPCTHLENFYVNMFIKNLSP